MNTTVPIEVVITEEEAALAPKGILTCAICPECFAIVPLYRMVQHGQEMHQK